MDLIEAIYNKDAKTVQTSLMKGDDPNSIIIQDIRELIFTERECACPDVSSWIRETIPSPLSHHSSHHLDNCSVDKVNTHRSRQDLKNSEDKVNMLHSRQNLDISSVDTASTYDGRQDFGNNSPEKGNQTRAIHTAVLSNCLPIVQLLHGAGADLSMKDDSGLTAFHLACAHGHLAIAQYLVEADPSSVHTIQDNTGNSVLMSAIIHHQHYMYSFLLNHIDLNAVNNTQETPLILAVNHRQLTLISALLEAGVTLDRRCKPSGDTALHVAVYHNLPQVVTLLLTAGAAASKTNDQGDTPIMMAIKLGFIDCVKELFIPSSQSYLQNCLVEEYLNLAATYGHETVLSFLLRNTTTLDILAKAVVGACNKRQYTTLKLLLSRISPQQLRHCFCEYELKDPQRMFWWFRMVDLRVDALTQAVVQCIDNDDIECVSLLLTEKTLILDFFSKYSNIYSDAFENHISDYTVQPFNFENHITKHTWLGVILTGHTNILKLLLGMVHGKYPSMHTFKIDAETSLADAKVAPKSTEWITSIVPRFLVNLEFVQVCIETGIVDVTYIDPLGGTYLSELLDFLLRARFSHVLRAYSLQKPAINATTIRIVDLARVFIKGGCPIRQPAAPEHPDLLHKALSISHVELIWEFLDAAPLPWKCTTHIDITWYKRKEGSAFSTVIKLLLLSTINVDVMNKEAGKDEFRKVKEDLFSLYNLCRMAIRVHLPQRRLRASRSLPIASRLADSIALLDICEPDLRTYEI